MYLESQQHHILKNRGRMKQHAEVVKGDYNYAPGFFFAIADTTHNNVTQLHMSFSNLIY